MWFQLLAVLQDRASDTGSGRIVQ